VYTGPICLVFTSAYEGFGLPPLEAMACGSPAVVFANSSLVEIAGPGAAVQPDGDASAMAEAVCAILDDAAGHVRRSSAGREWAAQFTWRRAAQMTLDVYGHALRR
jgi:alpha-1,3-rhamnosyl/mannosyltransferase